MPKPLTPWLFPSFSAKLCTFLWRVKIEVLSLELLNVNWHFFFFPLGKGAVFSYLLLQMQRCSSYCPPVFWVPDYWPLRIGILSLIYSPSRVLSSPSNASFLSTLKCTHSKNKQNLFFPFQLLPIFLCVIERATSLSHLPLNVTFKLKEITSDQEGRCWRAF